jgi:hypothetical protein
MLVWLLCLLAGAICRHMLEPNSEDYLRQVRRSLAARRYDDAEHTLRRLLVRHPARTDVRLALSELARNRALSQVTYNLLE